MIASGPIRRILLVRLRSIGDVVFTTPAVAALRRQFPLAHLTYIVEPAAAPIVEDNPHLTEVLVRPRRRGAAGLMADIAMGRRLRRAGYDLAIDFHGGPRASLLTWLSGAPVRIGYAVPGRGWMYTHVVGRDVPATRHSVENQWDLLRVLDIPSASPTDDPVDMPCSTDAQATVETRLAAWGIRTGSELVVVHVSASSPFRRWPLPAFGETVAALAAPPNRHVVVTSGPSERDATASVVADARRRLPAERAAAVIDDGNLSLGELRALLDRAALYVGGDTGPLHIAATTAVPIVALFGPTPVGRSRPWRDPRLPTAVVEVDGLACRPCDQRTCVHGDFRCLTLIEAGRVVAAAKQLLHATRHVAGVHRPA